MKNWGKYVDILKNPESLKALQNSDILPAEYIPYSEALLSFEIQEFHNFLCAKDFVAFRRQVDFERLFNKQYYNKRLSLDAPLLEAEKARHKARCTLNNAIYNGHILSVIFKFDTYETLKFTEKTLPSNFWRSQKAFNIDSLGIYFLEKGSSLYAEGLVALDRATLTRWGKAYPNPPSKAGRKRGGGAINDSKALDYMNKLITKESCAVLRAAEMAISELDIQGSSYEAKLARLRRKYKTQYQ